MLHLSRAASVSINKADNDKDLYVLSFDREFLGPDGKKDWRSHYVITKADELVAQIDKAFSPLEEE